MINPRLIDLAKRRGNEELPKERTIKPKVVPVSVGFPEVGESSILIYDQFGKELITKSNEIFQGTASEIPLGIDGEEVQNMYILKRLALVTAIHNNPQLRSQEMWPITPLQSEQLLKAGKLPEPGRYWEDLALILYSTEGTNAQEAQALYQSLQQNKDQLGLSPSELESRLLVVNAGLEVDSDMPHGVKPIILLGTTLVYPHKTLEKTCENPKFEYGLEHGLPAVDKLGTGSRTLYMPSSDENIGLRLLYRGRDLDLVARYVDLSYSYSDGRVNFARQGTT